jgi:SPP1 family predicted phage head-tail adaptor
MRNRLILQQKFITQDDSLNPIATWVDSVSIFCQVLPKTGREFYKYQTINNTIETVFKIRYRGNVNEGMRIKFKCKYYEILGIINVEEMNQYLHLTAKAVTGG